MIQKNHLKQQPKNKQGVNLKTVLNKFKPANIFKKYRSIKIHEKLSISFLVIAIVSNVIIGMVGIVNIKNINNMFEHVYSENLVPLSPLYRIESDFLSMKSKLNGDEVSNNNMDIIELNTQLLENLSKYSKSVTDPNEKKVLSQMSSDLCDFQAEIDNVNNNFLISDNKGAYAIINGKVAKTSTHFDNLINGLFNQKIAQAKQREQQSERNFTVSLITMGIITVILIFLSALFGRSNAKLISRPIDRLVKSANSIAEGNLDVDIDRGDGDEISILADAFNKVISSLKLLREDVDKLIGGTVEGNLSMRADTSRHNGAYRGIISGVNKLLDTITVPINTAADYIDDIGHGNIPEKITDDFKGDFNRIKISLNNCIDSVNALITDSKMLATAAVAGNLSVRADAAHHNGDFSKIIEGVNNTLDAITEPLNIAANYIDDISRGDIPEIITDDFKGDFNRIKVNLNTCICSVNALIEDAGMLSAAAVAGDLSVRADAARHNGDFGKIISGVNNALDSVINPLKIARNCVEQISRGDIPQKLTQKESGEYETFKCSINTCIDAINRLIADAAMLSNAAEHGNLSVRADVERHQGDFKKIISGVNNTFEAVVMPVEEAVSVLAQVSKGNLDIKINGDYKGELAMIKESVNGMVGAWSGYISEISSVLSQISAGNLDAEITSEFKGDFVTIKDSINNIIETFNNVISDIITAADGISAGSKQVSEGSQHLSEGAAEQAASIEQLTASIAEIAQKTRENAMSATKADQIANSVKKDTTSGSDKMDQMLGSMNAISESAGSISKIIKVINDIAFQTNILALNAAIEAARAGSYGRGFAVVAEEVRSLAARSADAANETTQMIDKSIDKSAEGTEIALNTSGAFKTIEKGVNGTAAIISEISISSNEQATGIAQINKGLEQVSKIVQTNSATAEQSAAASEELFSQAESMRELVSRFKVRAIK